MPKILSKVEFDDSKERRSLMAPQHKNWYWLNSGYTANSKKAPLLN